MCFVFQNALLTCSCTSSACTFSTKRPHPTYTLKHGYNDKCKHTHTHTHTHIQRHIRCNIKAVIFGEEKKQFNHKSTHTDNLHFGWRVCWHADCSYLWCRAALLLVELTSVREAWRTNQKTDVVPLMELQCVKLLQNKCFKAQRSWVLLMHPVMLQFKLVIGCDRC